MDHVNTCHKHGDNKLNRLYQCAVEQCYFATNYFNEFKSHNTFEHSGDTELKCIYCNTQFSHGDHLVKHLQENIMKLIHCPFCRTASQMKSVILAHISQKHPDKPKRIITTSYTTCQNKSKGKTDANCQEKVDHKEMSGQHGEESEALKLKPSPPQKTDATDKKAVDCKFVCGSCTFATDEQEKFMNHIAGCTKSSNSRQPALVQVPKAQDTRLQSEQSISQSKAPEIKESCQKSKLENRNLEASEVELNGENTTSKDWQQTDVTALPEAQESAMSPDAEPPGSEKSPGKVPTSESGGIPQPGQCLLCMILH